MNNDDTGNDGKLPLDRGSLKKRLRGGEGSHRRFPVVPEETFLKNCCAGYPLTDAVYLLIYLDFAGTDLSAFNIVPQRIPEFPIFSEMCDAIDRRMVTIRTWKNGIPLLDRAQFVAFTLYRFTDAERYLPWLSKASAINHLAGQDRTREKEEFLALATQVTELDLQLHGESLLPLRVLTVVECVYSLLKWPMKNDDGLRKKFAAERRWLREANIRRDDKPGARPLDSDEPSRVKAVKANLPAQNLSV